MSYSSWRCASSPSASATEASLSSVTKAVSPDSASIAKARGTDLLDGTVTLPLIVAMERDPELAKVELRGLSEQDAEKICDRIAATGALEVVRARALEMVAAAKRELSGAAFDDEQRELLEIVADGVVERYG